MVQANPPNPAKHALRAKQDQRSFHLFAPRPDIRRTFPASTFACRIGA
jgi:hypothetical protein